MISLIDRLQKRLKIMPGGCWEWQGYCTPDGYGQIWQNTSKHTVRVHRVMWEIVFGPIPDCLFVLHKCDNPPCANPSHLFLGTRIDNNADRDAKNRNAKGEKHGMAKLTWEQVIAIRADSRSLRVIAKEYGITLRTVYHIHSGKTWKESSNAGKN